MKRQWSSISAVSLALSQSRKFGQIPQNNRLLKPVKPESQNLNFADLVQRAWSQQYPQQTLGTPVQSDQVIDYVCLSVGLLVCLLDCLFIYQPACLSV